MVSRGVQGVQASSIALTGCGRECRPDAAAADNTAIGAILQARIGAARATGTGCASMNRREADAGDATAGQQIGDAR